ncbi:MAG: hypothetical protein M1840_006165 [Geoglossum simile]|nr:MAG: hypothetical protein M1840_006165 [Geoglossum simile]
MSQKLRSEHILAYNRMATLHDGGTQASSSSSNAMRTVTQLVAEVRPFTLPDGTLRLRGVTADGRRVMWAEDVVDNEGMGKKKSKGANTVKLLMPAFIYQQLPPHQYAASITNHALWVNPLRKRNRRPPVHLQKVTATPVHQAIAAREVTVITNAGMMDVGMTMGPERIRGRVKRKNEEGALTPMRKCQGPRGERVRLHKYCNSAAKDWFIQNAHDRLLDEENPSDVGS